MKDATILIVDDKLVNRQYLTTLLAYHGYRLLEAVDGVEALAIVHAARPDLVITDVLMPRMDGYEFVRQLREDAGVGQTPVIFYTAEFHEEKSRRLAQACGVTHVLTKPAEPEVILRAVHSALGHQTATLQQASAEVFDQEHLRLLTDRLAHKVSELENVNLQLKASEERLTQAVDVAQIGIWDCNLLTGKITWAYHTAQIFGMRPDEFDGSYEAFEKCIHPDDREAITLAWNKSVANGCAFNKEFRLLHSDGAHSLGGVERQWAFFDETGQVISVIGTVVDVTQRKEAEELARTQQAELAHLSRINTMGHMATGLAHELNQPLGAILNYAGAGLELLKTGKLSTAIVTEALEEIANETKRAGEIIRRMRSFVRKQSPKQAAVDINTLVKDALDLLTSDLRQAGMRTRLALACPDLPLVSGRCGAGGAGVGQFDSECRSRPWVRYPPKERILTMRTAAATENDGVLISVMDRGCGISQENCAKLFQAFFYHQTHRHGNGFGDLPHDCGTTWRSTYRPGQPPARHDVPIHFAAGQYRSSS